MRYIAGIWSALRKPTRNFLRRAALLTMLMISAAGFAQAPAQAAETPSLVIIFDGSGSMWGKLQPANETKFAVARTALGAALAELKRPVNVAITGFGYRRRGTCGQSETVREMAPFDATSGLDSLEGWNPRGRGPIGSALERAGELLKSQPAPRRILIVHDDPDNCRADVCAIAAQLKSDMPDLKIETISLRQSKGVSAMACVGKITGGQVQELPTSENVDTAVTAALKRLLDGTAALKKVKPKPVAPPPSPLAQLQPGVHSRPGSRVLMALARITGAKRATAAPVRWSVRAIDGRLEPIFLRQGQFEVPLPPGTYEIKAEAAGQTRTQSVTIADGQTSIVIAEFDAAELKIMTQAPRIPGAGEPSITLSREGADIPAAIGQMQQATRLVAAGRYTVEAELGSARASVRVEAAAGQQNEVVLKLEAGTLKVTPSARRTRNESVRVLKEPETGRGAAAVATQAPGEIARSAVRAPVFYLPPGMYRVVRTTARGSISRRALVASGQVTTVQLDQAGGILTLQTRIAGREGAETDGVTYVVASADDRVAREFQIQNARGQINLEPGRYLISSILTESGVTAQRSLVVTPGMRETITIEHAIGGLKLLAPQGISRRDLSRVVWDVRDVQGKRVWRDIGSGGTAWLPPGTYSVRALIDGKSRKADVTVRLGQIVNVIL